MSNSYFTPKNFEKDFQRTDTTCRHCRDAIYKLEFNGWTTFWMHFAHNACKKPEPSETYNVDQVLLKYEADQS